MKLQMQKDSLRVRIDEAELEALQAGATLDLTLGSGPQLLFSVRLALAEALRLQAEPSLWHLLLPRAEIADYVQTLPNRHALQLPLPCDGHALTLDFEVDVRDSLQVRGAKRRTPDRPAPT